MPNVIETKRLVCVDAINNNNKFWEYDLRDDNTVVVRYGRVGKTHAEDPPKPITRKKLDSLVAEKLRGRPGKPPYREITVVTGAPTGPTGPTGDKKLIAAAAREQLLETADPMLTKLIDKLVLANKHELHAASGGKLDVDITTGIISTPVGVVTKDNIAQARDELFLMSDFVKRGDFDDKGFINSLNTYLMLVPQQTGHARGWHRYFMTSVNDVMKQSQLLDQLEASAELAAARLEAAKNSATQAGISQLPSIFSTKIKICEDEKEIARIHKFFFDNVNTQHESRHLKPIRVYEVSHAGMTKSFETGSKVGNIQQLWHGTRMFNVLSILKSGLVLPKQIGTMQITGAMFGNGVYFSDQSTKSLNYAYGYWDRGQRDDNCFMFVCDVAMGKMYTPKSSYETLPKTGYDSTFAVPGKSGIRNNEMIVYNANQCNLRYLVEFDSK